MKLAYLSQEVAELDPALRVLEAVEAVRSRIDLGKGREMTASQLCERFGFAKEKQWTPVGDLSGGERRRLQILRLLMDEPNVLFLDEPTNDLDIETLTQLEDLLDGWPGSLVVISHDRYFVERTTDRVYALLGDCHPADAAAGHRRVSGAPGPDGDRGRRVGARRRGPGRGRVGPVGHGAGQARGALPRCAQGDAADRAPVGEGGAARGGTALHAEMAEHATDFERVAGLDGELREVREKREELEMRWLELADTEGA